MKESICCLLVLAAVLQTSAQQTPQPYLTVTYNPGEECLDYDDSVVPDCTQFIDPILKQPYYHEHSANCSRFWECGPAGETCLFECAPCGIDNPQCENHWALVFDVGYQYPDGPVCDWPGNVVCAGCPLEAECCKNSDCDKCPDGYCNLDFTCTYPTDCDCSSDSDCAHSDGVCNVPLPHTPDNCAYCDKGQCVGGCSDLGDNSDNCPGTHPTCNGNHECEPSVCGDHPDCDGYDQMCNANYDNCFFCGGGCGADDGCCQGCHDDSLNCQYPQPVCNLGTHTCGCEVDADCHVGDICNTGTHSCEPIPDECTTDAECNEDLTGECDVGLAEYTQCMYCNTGGDYNQCKPGCQHDSGPTAPHCPADFPNCNVDTHLCQAEAGSTLLNKIVFTSSSCEGCTREGVTMILTGDDRQDPSPMCKTVDLDYPGNGEFSNKAIFQAIPGEENYGWNNCYLGPLNGQVSEAVVTWTGEGKWTPNTICYDWDQDSTKVSICTFPASSLGNGQEATGTCVTSGDKECA